MNTAEFLEQFPALKITVKCIDDRPDVDKKDEWYFPRNPSEKPLNYEFSIHNEAGYVFHQGYYSKGIGHAKRTDRLLKNDKYKRNLFAIERARKKDKVDNKPTLAEVIDSMASDASDFINGVNFEEWADNFGYDTDSRKAEKTYNACQAEFNALLSMFGIKDVEKLICEVERD